MYVGKIFASKHLKSQFDKNLTVALKSTQKLIFIYSNFFDKIRKMVTKKSTNKKNYIQFFVSPVKFQKVKLRGFDTRAATYSIWLPVCAIAGVAEARGDDRQEGGPTGGEERAGDEAAALQSGRQQGTHRWPCNCRIDNPFVWPSEMMFGLRKKREFMYCHNACHLGQYEDWIWCIAGFMHMQRLIYRAFPHLSKNRFNRSVAALTAARSRTLYPWMQTEGGGILYSLCR